MQGSEKWRLLLEEKGGVMCLEKQEKGAGALEEGREAGPADM